MDLSGSWDEIVCLAESRLEHNKTERHVSRYGPDIETLGVAGELVARRFLGLKGELHRTFDGGADLRWRGWWVDVKATRLTPGLAYRFLQYPVMKPIKADIIFLTAVDLYTKHGTVIGWAWGSEMAEAPVNQTRDFPCREIPVRNLHPCWELWVLKAKDAKELPDVPPE